jgi:hypothetical protein
MTRGLRYPPFAKPGAPAPKPVPTEVELPPIENFLDELPLIDEFLEAADYPASEDFAPPAEEVEDYSETAQQSEEGWAAGSWQSYDWSAASALNRSTSSAVDSESAWSESDWPDPVSTPAASSSSDSPTADEIANALDGIAHRIRTGELVIDQLQGTPPEAAMAAALAVLLRMRG